MGFAKICILAGQSQFHLPPEVVGSTNISQIRRSPTGPESTNPGRGKARLGQTSPESPAYDPEAEPRGKSRGSKR